MAQGRGTWKSPEAHHVPEYDVPKAFTNLDEVAVVEPVQNPDEERTRRYESLEQVRGHEQEYLREEAAARRPSPVSHHPVVVPPARAEEKVDKKSRASWMATQAYTISYIVLFSILGTLARLGLQALTAYPGMPVIFSSIWPNFAGSFVMGYLAEDRVLFPSAASRANPGRPGDGGSTARKAHAALKKTIPLYIGLATGFCGSLTSFSAFMRDVFLALSNDLAPTAPRNVGYSLAAVLAVIILTVSLSLSAFFLGAHFALALEPPTPSLPYMFTRRFVDRFVVPLAWTVWLAVILLCIFPPDRSLDPTQQSWRGAATFALAFAPLGCLARFYASIHLNGRIAGFPLGTFSVNIAGTAILGMAWDLAHVPLGGVLGCQVLQGVEDGFCGCLTTVSTWVAELAALRRRSAYVYGGASLAAGLGLVVVIMGGLRWSVEGGVASLACVHSL